MILMGKRNNTKRVKIICHLTEMRCDRNERQFRFLDWMSIKRAGMLKKKKEGRDVRKHTGAVWGHGNKVRWG